MALPIMLPQRTEKGFLLSTQTNYSIRVFQSLCAQAVKYSHFLCSEHIVFLLRAPSFLPCCPNRTPYSTLSFGLNAGSYFALRQRLFQSFVLRTQKLPQI